LFHLPSIGSGTDRCIGSRFLFSQTFCSIFGLILNRKFWEMVFSPTCFVDNSHGAHILRGAARIPVARRGARALGAADVVAILAALASTQLVTLLYGGPGAAVLGRRIVSNGECGTVHIRHESPVRFRRFAVTLETMNPWGDFNCVCVFVSRSVFLVGSACIFFLIFLNYPSGGIAIHFHFVAYIQIYARIFFIGFQKSEVLVAPPVSHSIF